MVRYIHKNTGEVIWIEDYLYEAGENIDVYTKAGWKSVHIDDPSYTYYDSLENGSANIAEPGIISLYELKTNYNKIG